MVQGAGSLSNAMMSASLIGHESQAPLRFVLVSSVAWVTLLFVVSAVLFCGLPHALVGSGWRASLWGALSRGAADIYGFIQTRVHASGRCGREPVVLTVLSDHRAVSGWLNANGVASIHIRWRMTASLRAMATRARLRPLVLASRMPQAFSDDHLVERVRMMLAAV